MLIDPTGLEGMRALALTLICAASALRAPVAHRRLCLKALAAPSGAERRAVRAPGAPQGAAGVV